jgi:3-deoxy-manno-octulosonate cytidylyltransferase (CMP-KDO synthetase)
MRILGIIPARFSSTRFPGKPLVDIHGKPMIQHVYEQCLKAASLDDVVVATDDSRIQKAVSGFGGKVMMTSTEHESGTDRCAEVIESFIKSNIFYDVVINIQGDEPFIEPQQIDLVASSFNDPEVSIATLAKKIDNDKELFSPHVNKVIWNKNNEAVYFSRHPIPFLQKVEKSLWIENRVFYKHIGIYGYRVVTLNLITKLEQGSLEKAESLEQLRWIENGYKIHVKETPFDSKSIDTPEDLSEFLNNT